jgi:hypothetical protein
MPTKPAKPLPERVNTSLKQLAESASRLNETSDEFALTIVAIDTALKSLNLGTTAWYEYAKSSDNEGGYSSRYVGYAKINGKWGLALSTVSGYINYSEDEVDQWSFNEAPRWMRIEAVDHIPDLLDELIKQTEKLTTDLQTKKAQASELAKTIIAALPDSNRR